MDKTLDPRFLRTRKLIMDAYTELIQEKEFKQITVLDITSRATVNRATFYYHFDDKYDLSEKALRENMLMKVLNDVAGYQTLSNQTLSEIYFSLVTFLQNLYQTCPKSFDAFSAKVEQIIKEELGLMFRELLKKNNPDWSFEKIELQSSLLSWALFGLTVKYIKVEQLPSIAIAEEMLQRLI